MKGHAKLLLVLVIIVLLNLIPFRYAMATDNIIENFKTDCSLYSYEGKVSITYANIDENDATGAWVNGNWYPNETQIVLFPIEGKLSVDCAINGGIFFDGPGSFAIRFVDATAPGWKWDDPSTWVERKIKRAELEMSRVPVSWDPTPCIKAAAYEHWGGNNLISSRIITNESHEDVDWHLFRLQHFNDEFSEIHVRSDYAESAIRNLCLFDTFYFAFSYWPVFYPVLPWVHLLN